MPSVPPPHRLSVTRVLILLAVGALLTLPDPAAAQPGTITVGPLRADRGEKLSGFIQVPAGVDEGTRIPVTIVNGVHSGPVLALVAGTHGYEYPPITALHRVRAELDPSDLTGVVILVHVANLPSFLGRTIYYSPVDGKNLNRVYPGRPDGTVSERIAHLITTEVIDQSDFVVDMHCGDGNEDLRPYAYWMKSGDPELDARSRGLVEAFGLDHIVIDTDRPKDPGAALYTSNTALTRGKPGITTETGGLGGNQEEFVQMAVRGAWNVMRHLEMVAGEAERPSGIVWLADYEVVRSPATGFFQPAVRQGFFIAEGGLLGTLYDLFGDPTHQIRAPFAGVVNYVVATPPMNEGEPVAMVSRVAGEPPR